MSGAHAAAVLAIYQAGIAEGNATFETRAPDWATFTAARLPAHRFVATTQGQVTGWVAASPVSGRYVYAGVVEHSVYVHPVRHLPGEHRQPGAAPGGRVPHGGNRERIGQHHDRWRDVVLIERRSPAV